MSTASTFSYCGIDSSAFGCWYAPDESTRFEDKADYEVYDNDADWHDGGYYYGNKVKPREFTLNCYFEQINRKTKEKLMSWLDRNTSGKLVFSETPWKYYKVRPTKKVTGKQYAHRVAGKDYDVYSGTFSITFTAYEPWGFMSIASYSDYAEDIHFALGEEANIHMMAVDNGRNVFAPAFEMDTDKILYVISDGSRVYSVNDENELIVQNDAIGNTEESPADWTSIIPDDEMPGQPNVDGSTFYIYNCGAEATYPILRIGGGYSYGEDGTARPYSNTSAYSIGDRVSYNGKVWECAHAIGEDGQAWNADHWTEKYSAKITIRNNENGTEMEIVSLPPSGSYLQIDCAQGLVHVVNETNAVNAIAFEYHDKGYLRLEPCGMLDTDVKVTYEKDPNGGTDILHILNRTCTDDPIGKYLRLENKWFRINGKTSTGYALSGKTGKDSGSDVVSLVHMNQITISGTDVALDKLEIEYTPRVQ